MTPPSPPLSAPSAPGLPTRLLGAAALAVLGLRAVIAAGSLAGELSSYEGLAQALNATGSDRLEQALAAQRPAFDAAEAAAGDEPAICFVLTEDNARTARLFCSLKFLSPNIYAVETNWPLALPERLPTPGRRLLILDATAGQEFAPPPQAGLQLLARGERPALPFALWSADSVDG